MADDVEAGKMSPEMIAELLAKPVLARLATASPKTLAPHVVPVWFGWDGQSVWISAFRSTRKVRDLQRNPLCSIVIDDAQSGVDYQAIVFEGQAELVSEPAGFLQEMTARIYTRYLGPEGVLAKDPQSWIHDPENLLIKLTPQKTLAWYSARRETP